MSPQIRPEGVDLVQMAAVTDALVRSGPREAAVVATDRLAAALLVFSRRRRRVSAEDPSPAREALRLRAEAQVLSRRLRHGPVRLAPVFAWRVRQLVDVEDPASRAG